MAHALWVSTCGERAGLCRGAAAEEALRIFAFGGGCVRWALACGLVLSACVDELQASSADDGSALAAADGGAPPADDAQVTCGPDGSCDAPISFSCYDSFHRGYVVGETYREQLNCRTCECTAEGPSCENRSCRDARSCTLGDTTIAGGTSVVCKDGCNACTCTDGQWRGTAAGCSPLSKVERCEGTPSQTHRVEALYRVEDALALTVKVDGCAGDPEVRLCWLGGFQESETIQAQLRAYVSEPALHCTPTAPSVQRVFDLAPLRDAYRTAYPGSGGALQLQLEGATVNYTF